MQEAQRQIRTIATAQDPTLVRCFRGHEKTVNTVAFCPEMKQIASGSSDGIVHVWSFKPQMRPTKLVGHYGPVNDVVFTNNSSKIISCGDDREIKFWKNSVQAKAQSVKAHSMAVLKLALSQSPSSKFLVSCSADKTLKMWTLDGKFKQSYLGHTNWVRECQVANDQRILLSCSDDRTVKLWDLEQAKAVVSFSDHKDAVMSCKFSPDGTCIAGACIDGTIKLWDNRSNKLIQHYNAHNGPINQIDFHPYGYHMSSVSDDGKIKIWELKHGRLGWTLYGHSGQIKTVDFCHKGDYFATGATDNLVMIWRSNFDQGLASKKSIKQVPTRQNEQNYIQKDADTLLPMLKSNKNIVGQDIHRNVPKFGGVAQSKIREQETEAYVDPRKKNISEIMSSGLEKIVNQLDFVTRVVGNLDERIMQHEKTIQNLFEHPKVSDYLMILEESEKMKPQIYNSVWEAYRNAPREDQYTGSKKDMDDQGDLYQIERDIISLNKNLSDKKLPSYVTLQDNKAQIFRRQLDKQDQAIQFDVKEIEGGEAQQF